MFIRSSMMQKSNKLSLTLNSKFAHKGNNECELLRAVFSDYSITLVIGVSAATDNTTPPQENQCVTISLTLPEVVMNASLPIPIKIVLIGDEALTNIRLNRAAQPLYSGIAYTYLGRKPYALTDEPEDTQVLFHHDEYDALVAKYIHRPYETPADAGKSSLSYQVCRLFSCCDRAYALTVVGVATVSGGIMAANLLMRPN